MKNSDKSDTIKKKLLESLELTLGIVTPACKSVGISRDTYYEYLKNDAEFAEKVADIKNVTADFVESKLFKQIEEGNTTAIIFYLKTMVKHRGYIERQEITGANNTPIMQPIIEVVLAGLPKE
jgi:hypothetical protein